MQEYLAFVDDVGRTIDGNYIYRLDFTFDVNTVWGEYFNVTPSAIIPGLQPDRNCLSKSAKVIFPREMVIAKKNFCFSMQDCIDGIIPLIFSEIDDETLEYDGGPFYIRFGEEFEKVTFILQKLNMIMFDIEEVKKGDDSAIDDLIDNLDISDNDDDDNNDDEIDPDIF